MSYLLAPAPLRTVLALFTHTAPHIELQITEHTDLNPWFRQWKSLQHYIEFLPIKATPLSSTVQPLEQQPFHSLFKSPYATLIIGHTVVVVMAPQFGNSY